MKSILVAVAIAGFFCAVVLVAPAKGKAPGMEDHPDTCVYKHNKFPYAVAPAIAGDCIMIDPHDKPAVIISTKIFNYPSYKKEIIMAHLKPDDRNCVVTIVKSPLPPPPVDGKG